MAIIDIRQIKKDLRAKYRKIRTDMTCDEKRFKDNRIYENIVNSKFYQNAQTLICFVSTGIEVDTHRLIHKALRDGKKVAVPKCLNDKGLMKFYYIKSMNDLEKGKFALLEPNPRKCDMAREFKNSICIVPGFSFDPQGYRLGYGKGYYDRFLSKYSEIKIGVCYNNCVCNKLPHGKYDVSVNYLFTEKYVKTICNKDNQCKMCRKNLGGKYEGKPKRFKKRY